MTFLYLDSDRIGAGDDELGRKLLRIFLEKLVTSEVQVDFVACLNAGVFLTTEEGPALESLRALASRGATVMTCGTCLDHYGRRERLLIGVVGGMQQTVELFASADRIIAPC
ncbi:MAG TPA: DsrE family protein [Thermoanaerobaculaceae bacterium]|nr:DsrE family protein [Thermoanaerobaculaceae bacterium]HRS16910.1 DsrE family protein [Thermoanaerobaculaceae bacterium]